MSAVATSILLTTGGLTVFAAGAVIGHVATRWGADRDRERVELRKDTAVEAAFTTAFELQRISGDVPAVDVPLYDWADDDNPATLPRPLPDGAWRPAPKGRWLS